MEIHYVITLCFVNNFNTLFSNKVDSERLLHVIDLIYKVCQFAVIKVVAILKIILLFFSLILGELSCSL